MQDYPIIFERLGQNGIKRFSEKTLRSHLKAGRAAKNGEMGSSSTFLSMNLQILWWSIMLSSQAGCDNSGQAQTFIESFYFSISLSTFSTWAKIDLPDCLCWDGPLACRALISLNESAGYCRPNEKSVSYLN